MINAKYITSNTRGIVSGSIQNRKPPYIALTALLGAGLLLGLTTNLAKVANGLGLSPLSYLTWSLMGASLLLFVITMTREHSIVLNRRSIEYFIIAGFLSTAGANLIFFNAIPRLGVGFVAMMIALPPLFTYVGALLFGMERFCWWRMAGVLMALGGTVLLVANRWAMPDADIVWITLTMIGPVMLAAGNIYRSYRWPPGASAESLAIGMLIAGTCILFVYALVTGSKIIPPTYSADKFSLIIIQSVVFAGQFLLIFVLQKVGGPVFLSLMGGVSAIFGVPIAMGLLGEPVLASYLTSALLVTAGIASHLLGWKTCGKSIRFDLKHEFRK